MCVTLAALPTVVFFFVFVVKLITGKYYFPDCSDSRSVVCFFEQLIKCYNILFNFQLKEQPQLLLQPPPQQVNISAVGIFIVRSLLSVLPSLILSVCSEFMLLGIWNTLNITLRPVCCIN